MAETLEKAFGTWGEEVGRPKDVGGRVWPCRFWRVNLADGNGRGPAVLGGEFAREADEAVDMTGPRENEAHRRRALASLEGRG